MVPLSITACALLAGFVSAGFNSTGEPLPVLSTSMQFTTGFQQRAEWAECFELKGLIWKALGSIDVPCPLEPGLDNICTIYEDTQCQDEIISFDRPHYNLFTFGDKPREKAIGRRAASVKCRMQVTNREGHKWRSTSASSKFGKSCPGDPCSDDKDCEMSPRMFQNYQCAPTSRTCKQRRLLNSQVPRNAEKKT